MAHLHFNHIQKQYSSTDGPVIKDFNMEVEDGEFIVLVGPSGCGKSTMLKMIAGLEDVTAGEFFMNGTKMNSIPSKDRNISMVFQNYALYPHMTVFDNIAFGLKIKKTSKQDIKEKVEDAAAVLGLTDYLHRKPQSLSGGQRQRTALGRAIVRDADLLLMDEPLSNLDAMLRIKMRKEIIQLHKRLKTTTIYVTHDQTEALTMASRIAVMNQGEMMQTGTPQAVYKSPENLFTAKFIGSPAMNIFEVFFDGSELIIGSSQIPISKSAQQMLAEQGYTQQKIYFGIRPENIHPGSLHAESFNIKVRVSELLGSEYLIDGDFEGFDIGIKANTPLQPGDNLAVSFDMSHAHYFDLNSEQRIDHF